MMDFIKNFNNNAALVVDQAGNEWIVLGKGVGFGQKLGQPIDEAKIERRFKAAGSDDTTLATIKSVSSLTLEATSAAIKLIEAESSIKFDNFQYLALADHIDFAIIRSEGGIDMEDRALRWEVKRLFKQEYSLAKRVVKLINGLTGASLPASEEVLMTYHLVNAESDGAKVQDTMKITKLIAGIVDIVQYQYGLTLDVESFNYTRFIGHLRAFMVQRLSNARPYGAELDGELLALMEQKYPQAAVTVNHIDNFLQTKMGWTLNPDDRVYLILHVWRVTHRQEQWLERLFIL